MSLNQKYTWNDFLKENPEFKEKKVKRTSKEGAKAFESAFKAKAKEFLKERTTKIDVQKKKATAKRDELAKKVQDLQKKKDFGKAKIYQTRVGRQDAWLKRLDAQTERTKTVQKSI
ncbi:MAG: hypothetical protein ABH859_07610 [Pseudomonadota bacterium]